MHNKYLFDLLKDDFTINLISLENSQNQVHCNKNNISSIFIKSPSIIFNKFSKTNFINKSVRFYRDRKISKNMANVLQTHKSSIVEFMDIHSEAYSYLKHNPKNVRKTVVVIRAHTPWGLLKKTYFFADGILLLLVYLFI